MAQSKHFNNEWNLNAAFLSRIKSPWTCTKWNINTSLAWKKTPNSFHFYIFFTGSICVSQYLDLDGLNSIIQRSHNVWYRWCHEVGAWRGPLVVNDWNEDIYLCIKCILIFGGNGVNIYPINPSPNRKGVHLFIADLVYYCIERVVNITFILQNLLMEIQMPVVELIKRLKVLKCLICLNYI